MRRSRECLAAGSFVLERLVEDDGVVEEAATAHCGENCEGDEYEQLDMVDAQSVHLLPLETEVLKRLGRTTVELRSRLVLTSPRRQVALGDPR